MAYTWLAGDGLIRACRRQTSCDNDGALSIFMPIWTVALHAFRNIPCIALFHFFCDFGSIFDQCSNILVVLSIFLGVVFLVSLFSSVRLPFSSPIFFSLFLNFRLLWRVGLGSCLFHSFVCSPFPSFSHACFYRLVNKGEAGRGVDVKAKWQQTQWSCRCGCRGPPSRLSSSARKEQGED